MSTSKGDSAEVPSQAALPHDRFRKAYFGKPVVVRDVIVGFDHLLQRSAAAWIDFSMLE